MFLTLEDPRGRIKGSRDPLGVQPIWAGFGRHLVVNLTTVTGSVRQFTVLMVGRWLAGEMVERGRVGEDEVLGVFLRWEQVAAYARFVRGGVEEDVRGIERVRRNVADGGKVRIQDDSGGMILADQKVYGIWGLYSVSGRVSGLLDGGGIGVTALAAEFLERTARGKLRGVEGELERLVLRGGEIDPRKDRRVRAVAEVLRPELSAVERKFYGRVLRDAEEVREAKLGVAARRQGRLAGMLRDEGALEVPVGRMEMEGVRDRARRGDAELAVPVERVLVLEPLLAAAEEVFRLVQARSGQTVAALGRELADRWGKRLGHLDPGAFRELRGEIEQHAGVENAGFAMRVQEALACGDYADAIDAVVKWNAHVMGLRGGAPWIHVGSGGRLECRFRAVERALTPGDEMPLLWRNSYFIDSLKSVTRQVGGQA